MDYSYVYYFSTTGEWEEVEIPLKEMYPTFRGKKLEKSNFSFVCHDLSNLSDYVKQIDTSTFKILKRALPGPYTFILPGARSLPVPFKNKKTVGIRVPANNIALEIVKLKNKKAVHYFYLIRLKIT